MWLSWESLFLDTRVRTAATVEVVVISNVDEFTVMSRRHCERVVASAFASFVREDVDIHAGLPGFQSKSQAAERSDSDLTMGARARGCGRGGIGDT